MNFSLRHFPPLLLAALALLGLALGHLGASLAGLRLGAASVSLPAKAELGSAVARAATLGDDEIIVQRSLFAPQLSGKYSLLGKEDAAPTAPARSSLILLGTIAGGNRPIALTRSGTETKILHVGDALPDGAKVAAIGRQTLTLVHPDGSRQIILPPEIPPGEAPSVAGAPGSAIRATADNRYAIPREEAEKARGNLGELMKQARMEPHLVDGQTDGFEVKMLRPNTIFTSLGLQKGDIVKQVNGLPLDSPEKALQIFQQLREARHIVVAVERGGTPMTLEYNLD